MNLIPTLPSAPKFLVTGAAGKTGSAVVAQLLERGFPVRALVRSGDLRSQRLEKLGAEIVVASLFDPDQLLEAMEGVHRAYYCPPFSPFMLQSAMAFAVAAREAKLESIVQMGQWLSNPVHPALGTRQTWLIDQMFSMVPGVAHTIVNPGMFADNFLRVIDFASLLNLNRYDRQHGFPVPPNPSLSIDDPHWRLEHAMGSHTLADKESHSHPASSELAPSIF